MNNIISDKRSPIYYYAFETNDDKTVITKAKGIQFVEQELNISYDDTEFLTLNASKEIHEVIKLSPEHHLLKEIASIPQQTTKGFIIEKFKEFWARAKQIVEK